MTVAELPRWVTDGFGTEERAIPSVAKAFAAGAPATIQDFVMLARPVTEINVTWFRVIVRHAERGLGWADTQAADEFLRDLEPKAAEFVAHSMLEALEQ